LCEDCFPLQMCHVSVQTKTNERTSKAACLFPVLWHGDGVKGGRQQERQKLQAFQKQQTYRNNTKKFELLLILKYLTPCEILEILLYCVTKVLFVPVDAV